MTAHALQTTFPLARLVPMQPASIDPTFQQHTGSHYSWLDWGIVKYKVCLTLYTWQALGIKPRPSDLESSTLSTWVHIPTLIIECDSFWMHIVEWWIFYFQLLWHPLYRGCAVLELDKDHEDHSWWSWGLLWEWRMVFPWSRKCCK